MTAVLRTISAVIASALAAAYAAEVSAEAAGHNARGVELYGQQDFARAIEAFERAYRLAPGDDTIRRNLSNAFFSHAQQLSKEKRQLDAIRQLEYALEIDPSNVNLHLQLGAYFLDGGLIQDAIFRLEEAIELAPRNIDAHFLLGEAYFRDNDARNALVQWEWVEKADPTRAGLAERIEKARRETSVESTFRTRASRNFNIAYDPYTAGKDVSSVLSTLEQAYRSIGLDLGQAFPPTPIQVSLYSAEGFSEMTQLGDHIGGLYDGTKIRVPVIGADGKALGEEDLRSRLIHEYVHVVVHYLVKTRAPWWFNEGIAEALSRELQPGEWDMLQQAMANGLLYTLEELQGSQLERLEPNELHLAYLQAHAAVRFLRERYGMRGIKNYLRELEKETPAEEALRIAFRLTHKTLELELENYISSQ